MYFTDDQIISKLKSLIRDWEEEKEKLQEMQYLWEQGDPGSDPGLQYEQENKINQCWDKLSAFAKLHL